MSLEWAFCHSIVGEMPQKVKVSKFQSCKVSKMRDSMIRTVTNP
jgi:hypothetical protein